MQNFFFRKKVIKKSFNHPECFTFQSFVYTSPLGDLAAKNGVVINCIHFSPTDHIIAFSGMVSGQGRLNPVQFTAPVCVYKHKVNSSSHHVLRSQTLLPALPTSKDSTEVEAGQQNDSSESEKSCAEKLKTMLHQLDRIILEKHEEMAQEQQ